MKEGDALPRLKCAALLITCAASDFGLMDVIVTIRANYDRSISPEIAR